MDLKRWKLVRKVVSEFLDKSVELYCDNRCSKERLMCFLSRGQTAKVCLFSDRDTFEVWYNWVQDERLLMLYGDNEYYRYNTVMYKDEEDNIRLRFVENIDEKPNSFVYVIKADVRNINGLRHADMSLIDDIAKEIAKEYVDDFNNISLGKVYVMNFIDLKDQTQYYWINNSNIFYGNVTKEDISHEFEPRRLDYGFYELAYKLID